MITYTQGNMFDAQVDAIINTVNLVGVMGKGVAFQFKERFPENYRVYQEACKNHTIGIGNSLVVPAVWHGRHILIVNFPTKVHWRNPSEYLYVERGLDNLAEILKQYSIKSIAVPPLGAGNGGLEWERVRAMIANKLSSVDCDVQVFEPGHDSVLRYRSVKLTPAKALLVYMLDVLRKKEQSLSTFSAVKLVYFMQKCGADSLFKMQFVPYTFGPYCDQVKKMLHSLDGAYITGYEDIAKKPFEPFGLIDESFAAVKSMVESDMLLLDLVHRTERLLEGYWDEYGMELLSTVDYIITKRGAGAMSAEDIHQGISAWSERKEKLFGSADLQVVQTHLLSSMEMA